VDANPPALIRSAPMALCDRVPAPSIDLTTKGVRVVLARVIGIEGEARGRKRVLLIRLGTEVRVARPLGAAEPEAPAARCRRLARVSVARSWETQLARAAALRNGEDCGATATEVEAVVQRVAAEPRQQRDGNTGCQESSQLTNL
jgi:hypothetical protein